MYQASELDKAIDDFHARATQIKLGDSKEKVLTTLQPTQELFPASTRRPSETFMADSSSGSKSIVEIYYFRSGRIPDGINTDDEFMPYVFRDGSLVSIGWTALGGPKNIAKQLQGPTVIAPTTPQKTSMDCYHIGNMTHCD